MNRHLYMIFIIAVVHPPPRLATHRRNQSEIRRLARREGDEIDGPPQREEARRICGESLGVSRQQQVDIAPRRAAFTMGDAAVQLALGDSSR
jgi:hypothetical protein